MPDTPEQSPALGAIALRLLLIAAIGAGVYGYVRSRPAPLEPPPAPKVVESTPEPEPTAAETPAPETPVPTPAVKDFAALVGESQRRAVAAHPDLGKFNSGLNVRFRNKVADLRAHNDLRLKDPNWPESLADAVAKGPVLISLTAANGKTLYFDTEEQRDRYVQALQRVQPKPQVLPKLSTSSPEPTSYAEALKAAEAMSAPPPKTSATRGTGK